jgi:hypothetical protein
MEMGNASIQKKKEKNSRWCSLMEISAVPLSHELDRSNFFERLAVPCEKVMINSVNCVLAFLQNAKLFKHH